VQDVDDRDQQPQSGFPGSGDLAEPEHYAPFVLLDDPHHESERDQAKDAEDDCAQDDGVSEDQAAARDKLVVFGEAVRRRDGALCRPGQW
jgi:hypothetical protein